MSYALCHDVATVYRHGVVGQGREYNAQEVPTIVQHTHTHTHIPQKLTTTSCFVQEESSGGKQFRKYVSCFYAQGGNVGVLSLKSYAFLSLFRLFT